MRPGLRAVRTGAVPGRVQTTVRALPTRWLLCSLRSCSRRGCRYTHAPASPFALPMTSGRLRPRHRTRFHIMDSSCTENDAVAPFYDEKWG